MERLGPYRLVRLLARGGMGEVFLATLSREGGFEKRVALKRMLPELGRQPAFVEMFEREARLAAALNHRHIVQIFDFGQEQDGSLWLAMEHVHGVDLQSVLELCRQQGELLPCGLTVEIGLACCQALEYAHRATDAAGLPLGLVHRDVSPQNILLSYEGDVKLVDFGLAHRPGEDDGVEPGLLMGKLAYMSPEQADALPLDARSDLFSLGVVLYEASSGRRAFFGSDGSEAILRRVRAAEPLAPPDEVLAGLPGAPLAQVLRQALALHRRERFGDAQAFHDALLQAAQASGVRVGEPRLGGWLAERFPERMSLTAAWHRRVAPAEATAAAGAPIAVPAPGALRPGTARPEGAAPAVTGPLPALPADAARHGAGEVGTAAARRRYALGLAGLAAAGLAAALAYWPATPPSGEGSAPLTARAPAAIVAAMGVEPAGREGTSLRRTPAPEQVPAGATLPGQEGEAEGQLLRAEQELPRAAPSAARLDGAAAL
ncbi:MAG: hypothetical protein FJ125_18325, partial [Deltaproteobacteria bacterium]|nr:hypothetical protein [Deltaproteobacteria bacterium]